MKIKISWLSALRVKYQPFHYTSCFFQEYFKLRSLHVSNLKEADESPYPHKFNVTISLTEFIEKYGGIDAGQTLEETVSVAGW